MSETVPLVDLRPDHWAIVRNVLWEHVPDREVLAFGSRATWTARTYSDLDLAILGDDPLTLNASSSLAEAFAESDLPFKVDVVEWARIEDTFRSKIRRDGVSLQIPQERSKVADVVQRQFQSKGNWRASRWGDEISLEYGKAIKDYRDVVAHYRVFGTNGPIGFTDSPLVPGPGVILGRKGAYRGVQFSPDPFSVIDTAYYVRPKSSDLDMRWLYYAMVYHKLGEIDDGSPVPSTTRAAVYIRDLSVPPLQEQVAMAQVVGALDDKIDLNRRTNETLESMARAVFKDWFVDFGPTRAKAEGREPYLAPELWDLFPNMLDNGDKPVGWSVCPVSDLFEFNPRESVKKGTYTPYLNMAALPTSGIVADPPIHREYKSGSKFRDGDTLFARITPCLENGKTAYVFDMGNDIVGAGSTEFIVIRSRTPLPTPASYFLARDPEFRAHAERSMTGTSGRQRASREALSQYELAAPTDDQLWKALGDFVTPTMDKVIANAHESRALAQTRDLLLPKLMSGEIRLGEAEKAMEAVI